MRGPAVLPIVIAAGGTGGHFFPAEALAGELLARGRRVALMTDARSGGLQSPVFAGLERFVISGAGIAGRGAMRAGKAAAALAGGVLQARRILTRLQAAAVVGFGGYPSVAPVVATRLMRGRPAVVLHEQNAVLGRANRFLAQHADRLALSFPATERLPKVATVVTGNPVRPAIAELAAVPYVPPTGDDTAPPSWPGLTRPSADAGARGGLATDGCVERGHDGGGRGSIRLLVLGGSLGARVFSDVVPPALMSLPDLLLSRIKVTQQCRPEDLDRVRATYDLAGVDAELAAFFPDVANRLAEAHLVITRAGASTVAELAIAGRPAILVPLPGAIDDHQTANARALVDARGASMIMQADFSPTALSERLTALLTSPDMLNHAAVAARRIARPDAAARLADLVEELMRQEASA